MQGRYEKFMLNDQAWGWLDLVLLTLAPWISLMSILTLGQHDPWSINKLLVCIFIPFHSFLPTIMIVTGSSFFPSCLPKNV
jgi:hypothetical protein